MIESPPAWSLAHKGHHTGDPGLARAPVITSTTVYTALAPNRFKDFWRDLSLGAARLASSLP
jgi:hypothetical protein